MPKVVGIRFEKTPKTYYFDAGNDIFKIGDGVVVETARGVEYGFVSMLPKEISDDEVVAPLKPIIRVATPKDDAQYKKSYCEEAGSIADNDGKSRSQRLGYEGRGCRIYV